MTNSMSDIMDKLLSATVAEEDNNTEEDYDLFDVDPDDEEDEWDESDDDEEDIYDDEHIEELSVVRSKIEDIRKELDTVLNCLEDYYYLYADIDILKNKVIGIKAEAAALRSFAGANGND